MLARYGALGASSRVRMFQYLPLLQAAGISVRVAPLLRDGYVRRLYAHEPILWREVMADYWQRLVALLTVHRFDLVWIEKELFPMVPAWVESLLIRRNVAWVVDYDDAVFLRYAKGSAWARTLLGGKIDRVMRRADLVVGGNAYLAAHARGAGAPWVEVLPSVVDVERYAAQQSTQTARPADELVVGWIGSPSTVHYLDAIAPALVELGRSTALRLRVVGASFSWPGLAVECRTWTEASEVAEVQQFDVGIMPLSDTDWERGKCAYKLIQCMACGIPVVASRVGANAEVVVHGEHGFLVETAGQWIESLRALAADSVRAAQMGRAGRERVQMHYALQRAAPRLIGWFDQLLTKRRRL